MNNTSSISSSASNGKSSSDSTDIKYIEEGIDYEKTPKPLLFLKIAIIFLLLISTILACIQFGLNISKGNKNIDY